MLAAWAAAGFAPDLFWRVTPRVFTAVMQGALDARDRAEDRDVALAWHVESFARAGKRLPALEKVLAKRERGRRAARAGGGLPQQSPEDMLQVLREFQTAGAPLTFTFTPRHGSQGED